MSSSVEHRRQRPILQPQEEDEEHVATRLVRDRRQLDDAARPPPPSRPRRTVSSIPGDKTCWICYESSSEDPTRKFVHACDCTLLAHPDCLLEWLATPKPSSSSSSSDSVPRCPVCATKITVTEDPSRFLYLYRRVVRKLDRVSVVATVSGLAASGWFVASAYGMWALRLYLGDRVANHLVDQASTSNHFPFRLWLNLPLIPFALILSRTPLIDSLLPFLPLTLALSTHSPLSSSSSTMIGSDPVGLSDLTFKYPPSPTLTVCVVPWLRIVYFRLRDRVFRYVLNDRSARPAMRGLAGMIERAARDEQASREVLGQEEGRRRGGGGPGRRRPRPRRTGDEGDEEEDGRDGDDDDDEGEEEDVERRGGMMGDGIELVAELEYEFREDEEEDDDEHGQGEDQTTTTGRDGRQQRRRRRRRGATRGQGPDGQQGDMHEDDETERGLNRSSSSLRIGIGRLTSLLIGALIYPALSSMMGSCLFYLATRSPSSSSRGGVRAPASLAIKTLRRILGISSVIAASSSSSSSYSIASALEFLVPFSPSSLLGLRARRAGRDGQVVDPVWVRNTIGAGLVLVIRDAVLLTAEVLEKKRKQSRRIVERPVGETLSF